MHTKKKIDMKIRDIQNFRFFYKTGVRKTWDKNRDENFIGSSVSSNGRTKFGFFDIYHGDKAEKEGIEGFLRGFLDMAQDSQAIYEFLQNAVDANSTTFEMYYNGEYFLAFNNGSQFNFEGIRSILNVGVSTKSQDSSNIGKFGIGFKLIHRLVGEKSGLEELKNLSGPILFSWGNPTQLQELQNFSRNGSIEFEKDSYKELNNGKFSNSKNLPWLFKILLTNFPCQPEETIKDLKYQEIANAFTKQELTELANWAKNKIKVDTTKHSLNNGSLFFLRLGKDKGGKLSNKRIEDGIQFSLSILNNIAKFKGKQGISQIRVNENTFEAKRLFFERFVIKFGSEEYNQIKPQRRSEEDTSDIEVLVGFMDYRVALKEVKGNPNFYLFFPLSEEVHNLSFIIHSTGFYNASQRTNLQGNESSNTETQGINEALLEVITEKIKQKLLTYRRDTVKNEKFRYRFLNIYSNLLLSNKATENHKNWVDNCLIEPIFNILKLQVPTQNGYSDTPENVKIKATHLPIQPSDLGCSEIEWFVWWEDEDTKELIKESRNPEKLHLEKWDIVDLLKYAINKGKIEIINEWVKQANERHFSDANNKDYTYLSFVREISKKILESDLPIISQIKLFKFSDDNYYSLNEIFSNPNLVLVYDKIAKIKRELRFLGLIVSDVDISYKKGGSDIYLYSNLRKLILPQINEEDLFKVIAEKSKQNNLRAEQKHNLFFTLAELDRVGAEKLKDLELFKDTQGNIRTLRTLLKGDLQVPNWLFGFKIHKAEYIPELDKYLVKKDEIYQSIIYNNWATIIQSNNLVMFDFYSEITYYYSEDKANNLLSSIDLPFIATNEGFKKSNEVFYNPLLDSYGNLNYDNFQNAIYRIASLPTPHFSIRKFLSDETSPFKINNRQKIGDYVIDTKNIEFREIATLLEFAKQNNEKFFSVAYVKKESDTFLLVKHSQSVFQYYSNRQEINDLLSNQPNFKLLPKEFNANDFRELGIWQDKDLYMKVLQNLEFSENLLPIVLDSEKDVRDEYLKKIKDFSLREGKVYDKNSFEHNCLKLAIDCYADDFQTKFAPKILINGELRIKDIAVKDKINFEGITLSLSVVLPDYDGISNTITKIIQQFTDFTKTELHEKVFPIKNKEKDEIYSELVAKFTILQNIEQFAFLLYYSKLLGKNLFANQSLTALSDIDILQFAHKQKFTELTTFVNVGLQDKIYPSELALEPEKLPTWVLTWLESTDKQEKLSFLSALGVHTENSNVCTIRRFFQVGQSIDVQAKVVALSEGLLLNTLKWLQGTTFKTSEIIKLEGLKQIFSRLTYSNEIPLLYISQITESEILYILEVSNATKYYFEIPHKDYSQKISSVLQSKGFKLIALDYFEKWKGNINPLKIEIQKPLDFEKIKTNRTPWDNPAYNAWEGKSKYPIFIYKGDKIPYKVQFLESEIDTYTEGTSIEEEGIIYVCQSVSDIPQELLTKKLVSTEDLLKLYALGQSNNNEVISIIQEHNLTVSEIQDLIRIKEWLNRPRPTFEPKTDTEIKAISKISNTGIKGEDIVNQYLISKFGSERVVWVSQKGEARYDFEVLSIDKIRVEMYVDAKATITNEYEADKIPILIRTRAWDFLKNNKEGNFFIARVFDVDNATPEKVKLIQLQLKDL